MNKSEKLQAVTEAIHKACSDLLELKEGCKVYCEQGWEDENGGYHDEYGVVTGDPDDEGTCMVLTNSTDEDGNRFLWPMLPTQILGQPIRVDSVLRAIGNRRMKLSYLDSDPNILVFTDHEGNRAYWDLTKTLDQQEEPVIDLLYNIFYP